MALFKYGRNEAKDILNSQFNFSIIDDVTDQFWENILWIYSGKLKIAMRLVKDFGPIAITVLCEYVYWNFRGEELAIIVWIFFSLHVDNS